MTEVLSAIINYAFDKHSNQTSNDGTPYIMHPVRVMSQCVDYIDKIIAILHDVIEDTDGTISDIEHLLGDVPFSTGVEIIEAIVALTRIKDETYEEFIARLCLNDRARGIKRKDINDNMSKYRSTSDDDTKRKKLFKKYTWAIGYINEYERKSKEGTLYN